MAVRDDFTAGEVLAAADLNDTFASKANYPSGGTDGQALIKSGATTAWGNVGGLILVTSEAFSGVSSVSINNCFSATYDNYLVMFTDLVASGGVPGNLRLRASGSDASGSNYTWHDLTANGGSVVSGRNTSQTSGRIISLRVDANGSDCPVNIFRPFLATETNYATQISYDSFSGALVSSHVGTHNVTSSYDGFTFFPASGTVTGNIRVYGYRN